MYYRYVYAYVDECAGERGRLLFVPLINVCVHAKTRFTSKRYLRRRRKEQEAGREDKRRGGGGGAAKQVGEADMKEDRQGGKKRGENEVE